MRCIIIKSLCIAHSIVGELSGLGNDIVEIIHHLDCINMHRHILLMIYRVYRIVSYIVVRQT